MNNSQLPKVDATDRCLIFDGVKDSRYTFPMWSWMSSRGMQIFFKDGNTEQTIGGKWFGEIEVLIAAIEHRTKITA